MANTYTLIASNTLSSSAASVTFSSIPNTFTDLVLKCSIRNTNSNTIGDVTVALNSITANYGFTYLQGNGASASSFRGSAQSNWNGFLQNGNTSTADTFSSFEIYLPNYAGSQSKTGSTFMAQEHNATTAYLQAFALLQTSTAAITSVTLGTSAQFVSGSTFFLYGIQSQP